MHHLARNPAVFSLRIVEPQDHPPPERFPVSSGVVLGLCSMFALLYGADTILLDGAVWSSVRETWALVRRNW